MKTTERRHERQRTLDITASAPGMRDEAEWLALFPPRDRWHRVREQNRSPDSARTQERALLRAVCSGLGSPTPEKWAVKMKAIIGSIQRAALNPDGHRFHAPLLIPFPKSDPNEFRIAASMQTVEDKVIDRLHGSYLRAVADPHLVSGSVAYRAPGGPDREHAIHGLVQFCHQHKGVPLFVAEVDIQAFFDCIPHEAALCALDRLSEISPLDPRARAAIASLLACYDRPSLRAKEAELRALHRLPPEAVFPWPQEILSGLHGDLDSVRIGLPQGTAISTVLANLVLCDADRASIAASQAIPGAETAFFRYCDDGLWVGTSEHSVADAQGAFLEALLQVKLPVHPPTLIASGAAFYRAKSKLPYRWSVERAAGSSRWIAFLGYQIDRQGELRVRKDSIESLRRRMAQEVENVLELARRPGLRLSPARLFRRTSGRLLAFSTGRVGRSAHYKDADLRCWAKAFRLAGAKGPIRRQLRGLDHHRHKMIQHLFRRLLRLARSDEERDDLREAAATRLPPPSSRSFVVRFGRCSKST